MEGLLPRFALAAILHSRSRCSEQGVIVLAANLVEKHPVVLQKTWSCVACGTTCQLRSRLHDYMDHPHPSRLILRYHEMAIGLARGMAITMEASTSRLPNCPLCHTWDCAERSFNSPLFTTPPSIIAQRDCVTDSRLANGEENCHRLVGLCNVSLPFVQQRCAPRLSHVSNQASRFCPKDSEVTMYFLVLTSLIYSVAEVSTS